MVVGPRYSKHHTDTPFTSSTPDIFSVDSTDSKICVCVRYGLQLPPSLHQPLRMPSSELLLLLPNPAILIFFYSSKKKSSVCSEISSEPKQKLSSIRFTYQNRKSKSIPSLRSNFSLRQKGEYCSKKAIVTRNLKRLDQVYHSKE